MISRAHMRRQLRANGGITNLRQGYGLGDFVRKLIPNELASVASKAAPFVAPFNPLAAGIMRGVGRYDKRGSLKDALKQGVLTYAGGQGARILGGAGIQTGFDPRTGSGIKGGKFLSDFRGSDSIFKNLIPEKTTSTTSDNKKSFFDRAKEIIDDPSKTGIEKTKGVFGELNPVTQGQIITGGGTFIATLVSEALKDEPEQQPGETMEEYNARRKQAVSSYLRTYLSNTRPTASAEEIDTLVERYTSEYNQGGRVGLAMGGDPLPEDPTKPINPFGPKPTGPVLPDNSMMASYGYDDAMGEAFEEYLRLKKIGEIPMDMEFDEYLDQLDIDIPYGKKPTAPNIRMASNAQNDAILERLYEKYLEMGLSPEAAADAARREMENMQDDFTSAPEGIRSTMAAQGGRIGYSSGSGEKAFSKEENLKRFEAAKRLAKEKGISLQEALDITLSDSYRIEEAQGGRIGYAIGSPEKQLEAGAPPIMYSGNMDPNQKTGLPSIPGPIQMAKDGPEFDMRENGGFQPLGRQEGKDDVPAMLAKNEFVMTADAVRAAGGGSIEKGAQKMYDTMKKLESRVS